MGVLGHTQLVFDNRSCQSVALYINGEMVFVRSGKIKVSSISLGSDEGHIGTFYNIDKVLNLPEIPKENQNG